MPLRLSKRGLVRAARIGLRVAIAALIALALFNLKFGFGVEFGRLGVGIEARNGFIRVGEVTGAPGFTFGASKAQLPLKPWLERWTFYTPYGAQTSTTGVWIPIWMLIVALLPPMFLIRAPRKLGIEACGACGYNISGLPAGACCPECGRVRTSGL